MFKFDIEKNKKGKIRISTSVLVCITFLVGFTTLCMAIFSMFFVNRMFTYLVPEDQLSIVMNYFSNSLQRLVLAFFIFGGLTAYFVTRIILGPLETLSRGTSELAKGNLAYRFTKGRYTEINVLVDTYNKMAEALQTLYNSLEQKVEERTKELASANEELKNTQVMMIHSEKMRSLGQLVAGITHEINNPVNFIHGNLIYLKQYSEQLLDLISNYEKYEENLSEEQRKELKQIKDNIELDFIREDLPSLIKSCQEGTERTKNIVMDLKNFSRLDEMVVNDIDLPKEIDTTLNILHNKIKNKIEIVKDYNPDIPIIEGYGGQLNQVFMNILDNACYAIQESGKIYIRLKKEKDYVIIEFEDTGAGIPEEQVKKIFEPFFTTKPVGQGTGLGMSISYKVIQRHNGTISVKSEIGKGTVFTIKLPIALKKEKDI